MTRFFVRHNADTGKFIAMISREDHYPPPLPRGIHEDVLEINSDMFLLVNQKPEAWNYAGGEVTPLIWGRLSVSSMTFYPSREDEDQYADKDFFIEIQPQFDDLPVDELMEVSINNVPYQLKNKGQPGRLRSAEIGLYSISMTDNRVLAETPNYLVSCIQFPEVTDGN